MFQDFRFAARQLLRHRGFAFVAVTVLTLAIAANVVVFSLVYPMLLEPLPFPDASRLVRIYGVEKDRGELQVSVTEAQAVRREVSSLTTSAAFNTGLAITDAEQPLNPLMRRVSSGHFKLYGVEPLVGRGFAPEDHVGEGARVTMLHEGFWQARYGGEPEVVGRTIELAGEPHEIVGVVPASFRNPSFTQPPVLWLPLGDSTEGLEITNGVLVGRLEPGATPRAADRELAAVAERLVATYPEELAGRGLRAESLQTSVVGPLRPPLFMLFVAVSLVLLVACGNIANLLLARAISRRREIAVRVALGAGRRRLARQLLVESLLLAGTSATLGLLLASWSLGPLLGLAPSTVSLPLIDQVGIDLEVVVFTLGLAAATAMIFGLFPLAQLLTDPASRLSAGAARSVSGGGGVRRALVVAEIAFSTVLLIAAGLMVRSLMQWRAVDPGFEVAGLKTGRTGARGPGLDTPDRYEPFHREALDRLRALPGVEAAASIEFLPMFAAGFGSSTPLATDRGAPLEAWPRGVVMAATPGYFEVFGQPILTGRGLLDSDRADAPRVAVISRTLERQLFGDTGSALGRQLWIGDGEIESVRLVGVAGDLRGLTQAPEAPPILFVPLAQRPRPNMSFLLRTELPFDRLKAAAEEAIWGISRDVPVYGLRNFSRLMSDLEWQPRFVVQLLSVFAVLALVMASTGLYGVLAYAVADRRREIGVRMAVGAGRVDIVRMVQGDAARLAAAGLGLGLAGAVAAGYALRQLLFGVDAVDPITYALVVGVLASVVALASWFPAWRASRVDPVEALRTE